MRILGLKLISEAHSDWLGLLFGFLGLISFLLIILISFNVIKLQCVKDENNKINIGNKAYLLF